MPSHNTHRATFVAQIAILAVVSLLMFADLSNARTGIVFGTTSDRINQFTRIGGVTTLSDHLALYMPVDLGDGQESAAALPVMTVYFDHTFTLGFLLGPEVQITSEKLTPEQQVTYLEAATGVVFSWNLHPDLSVWGLAQLNTGDADTPDLKIGFGIIGWVD